MVTGVASQKFISELRAAKRRFLAHHPQTEKRLGPRLLRMTAGIVTGTSEAGHWNWVR
jgi:hypothetical protein